MEKIEAKHTTANDVITQLMILKSVIGKTINSEKKNDTQWLKQYAHRNTVNFFLTLLNITL